MTQRNDELGSIIVRYDNFYLMNIVKVDAYQVGEELHVFIL